MVVVRRLAVSQVLGEQVIYGGVAALCESLETSEPLFAEGEKEERERVRKGR